MLLAKVQEMSATNKNTINRMINEHSHAYVDSHFIIFVLEFPYPIRRGMMRNGVDGKVDCNLQSLALDGLDKA